MNNEAKSVKLQIENRLRGIFLERIEYHKKELDIITKDILDSVLNEKIPVMSRKKYSITEARILELQELRSIINESELLDCDI